MIKKMDNNINLKEIEKKAYKQLNEDGLMEIALSVLLILYSGLWNSSIIGIVVVFQIMILPRLLESLRARYTYPRIGYVKLFDESNSETGKGIIGFMIASLLIIGTLIIIGYGKLTSDLIYQWVPSFIGLTLVGAMLYVKGKSGDDTYLGYAVYSILSGISFSFIKFDPVADGIKYYLFFIGFSMLVIGIYRFMVFTRKYQVYFEENSDERE
jgi:hypothetical protein